VVIVCITLGKKNLLNVEGRIVLGKGMDGHENDSLRGDGSLADCADIRISLPSSVRTRLLLLKLGTHEMLGKIWSNENPEGVTILVLQGRPSRVLNSDAAPRIPELNAGVPFVPQEGNRIDH
jgi:hypothetical protein